MKRTWKWFLFSILELLFVAVLPLIIVFIGYDGWGEEANQFKIYFGVLLFIVIIFWIVKKVFISPWLDRQKVKMGNLEAQLETENDAGKIANIESALKTSRLIETVCSWALPLLFFLDFHFLTSNVFYSSIEFFNFTYLSTFFIIRLVFSLTLRSIFTNNKE